MNKQTLQKEKYLTKDEVQELMNYQKINYNFDFLNERVFMEELLNTRFNFLIVAFTLFLTAGVMAEDKMLRLCILGIAIVFHVGFALIVYRAWYKVNIVFNILKKIDNNPYLLVDIEAKKGGWKAGCRVNKLIGIYFPAFMIWVFVVGFIYCLIN